jgi:hypothetical protein
MKQPEGCPDSLWREYSPGMQGCLRRFNEENTSPRSRDVITNPNPTVIALLRHSAGAAAAAFDAKHAPAAGDFSRFAASTRARATV